MHKMQKYDPTSLTLPNADLSQVFLFPIAHPWLTLVLLVSARILYDLYLHPLANIPGPRLAAISDFWRVAGAVKKDYAQRLQQAHAKYGPIVRIATNEVSILDAEEIKQLYGHHSDFVKGPFYSAFKTTDIDNLFSERGPIEHAIARRQLAYAYSTANIRSLETACDDSARTLLEKHLDKAAASEEVVDLGEMIKWFSYDAVADISFGKTYGLLDNSGDTTGFLKDLEAGGFLLATIACFHRYGWIVASVPVQRFLAWCQPDKGLAAFLKAAAVFLRQRRELMFRDPVAYHERKDMLYRFIETKDPVTGGRMSADFILRNTVVIVMAGGDTTMVSINAVLRYVYTHPAVLTKLRQEISEAIALGWLQFPSPSYDQVIRLEYLQAVIKEGIRLHPAITMPMQRVVPKGGRMVAGRFFPAGTIVGISPYLSNRSEEVFGKDAKDFRPERWLGNDKSDLAKYDLSFGQGSRVCIGKAISIMEMSKLLPQIFHDYDISFPDMVQPYKFHSSWFSPQYDFLARIDKREVEL